MEVAYVQWSMTTYWPHVNLYLLIIAFKLHSSTMHIKSRPTHLFPIIANTLYLIDTELCTTLHNVRHLHSVHRGTFELSLKSPQWS